jgi:hypothetical protein
MAPLLTNAVRATPWSCPGDTPAALRLARVARQALIAEAELTPKPGLVDRVLPAVVLDADSTVRYGVLMSGQFPH